MSEDGALCGTEVDSATGTHATRPGTLRDMVTPAQPDRADNDPYRLPHTVQPTRYDLRLRPSLPDASFSGDVTILLDVAESTDTLVLNAIELEIDSVRVDGTGVSWALDAETERLIVQCETVVTEPTATLEIAFRGVLNDKLRGFYRSTYLDDDGVEQVVATTQMQATDCRRAFPCWDEPEFKAVFGITLDIDERLEAISNGPEVERSSADGRTVIRFADTMKMSSYLVAFVVGDLEMTDPIDVDGTPLRVVHIPGKSDLTQFGLDVGEFCLRWFQEYYDIPYPSEKVDLVGLPDFAAGAMENLGCITFRESLLLVDPATSTQQERQLVADVVAHELAHMWFGDLVTMRWWNGIWLNEAFATFMEIAACDAFAPDWNRWTSFGLERSAAFETDSLHSTRAVEFEVRSPDEAEGMFDVLTYQKGGALLRMLEQYLGTGAFQQGVSHYLRAHAYSNTETSDLWDAIEATSGEPVRRIMDSWIWQPGYPLISAELDDSGALVLRQRRFSYPSDSAPDPDSASDGVWAVPLRIRSGENETTILLDSAEPTTVAIEPTDGPIVVNAGGHSFCRVSYDAALLARLADPAALTTLDALERYCLVDDAWSATVAGTVAPDDLLAFLEGFSHETEFGVVQAITIALNGLSRILDGEALDAFRGRVRALLRPALDAMGEPVDGESDLDAKRRGLLTTTLGNLGADAEIIARCHALLERERDGASVDAELLSASTSVVASTGNTEDYERFLAGFASAGTPQEALRNLYALAEFDDPDLIARTCEFAMSDAVKTQNAPFVLRAGITNREHGPVAWDFVKAHWDEANERFPENTIVRMVATVTTLTTSELVTDVQGFLTDHPIEQATQTLEQILERQRVNAALRSRAAAPFAAAITA